MTHSFSLGAIDAHDKTARREPRGHLPRLTNRFLIWGYVANADDQDMADLRGIFKGISEATLSCYWWGEEDYRIIFGFSGCLSIVRVNKRQLDGDPKP